MFFVPITIAGKSTIPLDHLVTAIRTHGVPVAPYIALALILLGTIRPFATGSWRGSATRTVFALPNVVGLVVAVLMLTSPPACPAAEDRGRSCGTAS